jgi:tetraacyldisaccharide 4'-kinase
MVEYLIGQLATTYHVATLSRGYGRKSTGFRQVTAIETAETVGDEPLQLFKKFGNQVLVFVGEDRALSIPAMLAQHPEIDVIVLDDAFQHRSVKPQFSILVTDARKPLCSDHVLPMGMLREARRGASRADVVVVTKCARDANAEWQQLLTSRIHRFAPDRPVLFAGVRYRTPVGFLGLAWEPQPVIAVTGIANFGPFAEYVGQHFKLLHHFHFPDHHIFTRADVQKIMHVAQSQPGPVALLTTEKDFTRLQPFCQADNFKSMACFYLPIEMEFLSEGGKVFDSMLNDRIARFRS